MQTIVLLLSGLSLNFIGALLIFVSWRKNKRSKSTDKWKFLRFLGWAIVLFAGAFWSQLKGVEYGVVYWLCSLVFFAWLLITLNSNSSERAQDKRERQFYRLTKDLVSRRVITFLMAGPLSMIAACLVALLLGKLIAAEQANQLVWSAFIFPILWGLLSFWICATSKRLVANLLLWGSSLGSGLLIFVG